MLLCRRAVLLARRRRPQSPQYACLLRLPASLPANDHHTPATSGIAPHPPRPIVGITTYLTAANFGDWEMETALVPAQYVHAVETAGGRAVLVPPRQDGVEE